MDNDTLPTPLLIRDLMTVGVLTVPPEIPVDEVARLMLEKDLEAVIVLDPEDGHAVGYVSQDDLVAAFSRIFPPGEKAPTFPPVSSIMCEDIPQAPPDIPLSAAAQFMRDRRVRVLFMMHHAGGIIYPAGILTFQHLLRRIAARTPEELKDLGIKASRQSPLEQFLARREEARKRAGSQR